MALLALASQLFRKNRRLSAIATVIAIFAAALFYGDAVITPAISVLSAVEGISVATPALERWVVPATIVILIGVFALQPYGTGRIGKLFGPIMVVWFLAMALAALIPVVPFFHENTGKTAGSPVGAAALHSGASVQEAIRSRQFWQIGFGIFLVAGTVGAMTGINGMTTALYPARVRTTGMGWALGIGCIGMIGALVLRWRNSKIQAGK